MTNNNWIETIKKVASETVEENYWVDGWDGSAGEVEQLIILALKKLLTQKDQEHKAELEAIRAEIEDGRIQDSEFEHILTVVPHNDVIDDNLLILDKHINK